MLQSENLLYLLPIHELSDVPTYLILHYRALFSLHTRYSLLGLSEALQQNLINGPYKQRTSLLPPYYKNKK